MFILPVQAGGGSCARFEGRSVLGCTAALPSGCASWVRSTNASYWVREIAHNLGLQSGNVPNHATFFDCRLL
jgi:hypothetical protein